MKNEFKNVTSEKTRLELEEIGLKAEIDGAPVTIVSQAEGEEADYVACVLAENEPEQFKSDNVHTTCFKCGRAIVHRPHAPKRPLKVCLDCILIMSDEDEDDEDEDQD